MSRTLVDASARFLAARTTRRGFLARTAVVGSALAVAPGRFILRPGTAYAAVCGPDSTCGAGYSVFCCTINGGSNTCPPGTFPAGWWKADNSNFCCGRARYYIDCQGECTTCTSGCSSSAFCSPSCVNCSCYCASGTCDERHVCCNYFRYGQCHQEVDCSGPVACRMVTCTPPYQLDLGCTSASATDNRTLYHSAPCLPDSACSAIDEHYYALGGPSGFLGDPVGPEVSTPDGVGRYRLYQGGSIYWSPRTGAREVHGAIRDKWGGLGYERGLLGYPLTDERVTPDKSGRYNVFEHGSVYWSPPTGAHEVHGAIRDTWAAHGYETGVLGYPTSDEIGAPDGVGRIGTFTGGSIYWTPATGAHEVHGAIRDRWTSLGSERGLLGYPVTDELPAPDRTGRYNVFARGSIYWSPATGAHEVHGAIGAKWAALGYERGFLGYPTSNESPTGDRVGRVSTFAGGSIYWSPRTGAHEVHGPIRTKWLSLGAEDGRLGYPTSDEFTVTDGRRSDFEHGSIVFTAATGEAVATPGAPATIAARAGDGEATVTWAPPANNGGAPVDNYLVRAKDTDSGDVQEKTVGASTMSTTVTGLTNGHSYVLSVAAHNSAGYGPPAAADPVTPRAGAARR